MVRAFRNLGHEVRVVSLIGERTNSATTRQRSWSRVARLLPGRAYELAEMAYNVPGALALARAVREFKPDFIYDRYVSYGYAAIAVARRYRRPVLLEVNSPYSYQKQTFDERLYFRRLSRTMERRICEGASKVIVVSTPLKEFLVSIGVPESHIVVMPNGADPEVFHPRVSADDVVRAHGLQSALVVGFSGILRPWHGLDLLVDAFAAVAAEFPRAVLLVVGDGPSRADVERIAKERGLADRVIITGRQPHERVRSFVAAMDVAVSPRATFYASPMKILEYMAMGKAIVAPDMANIRDILTDGVDAVFFKPEDPIGLASALRTVLRDDEVRQRLGGAARQKIERERTWAANARRVIELATALR